MRLNESLVFIQCKLTDLKSYLWNGVEFNCIGKFDFQGCSFVISCSFKILNNYKTNLKINRCFSKVYSIKVPTNIHLCAACS